MKKENEVVKQIFHSRGEGRPQGSEIFLVRAFNKWLELLLKQKTGHAGDPRQKRSGMTLLFNNGGFTLIELLVVVLIIGILAAVAVPQYQKAVEKSHAGAAISLLKSVYQAQKVYYLANGVYAEKFEDLDVDIPWTGREKAYEHGGITDVRSNGEWSLALYHDTNGELVTLHRLRGKYGKKGGFQFILKDTNPNFYTPTDTLLCVERKTESYSPDGSYCVKIFGGVLNKQYSGGWDYKI